MNKGVPNPNNPIMGLVRAMIAQRFKSGEEITVGFLKIAWPAIVGADLSRRTIPLSLEDGRLELMVASRSWVKELTHQKPRLLKQINNFLPQPLSELHIVAGPAESFSVPSPPPPLPPPPLGELTSKDNAILESIDDPELKELLTRVRRKAIGQKSRDKH